MTLKRLGMSSIVLVFTLFGTAQADNAPVLPPQGISNAWQPKAGDEIRFDVLRKGNPFGTHSVSFEVGPGNALIAKTNVSLKAGLGPLTVFRYNLTARETWRDGQLIAVSGEVNDDGKKESMAATLENGRLKVQGSGFDGSAPADAIPGSNWNIAQIRTDEWLSTENGEILDVSVTKLGRETIEAAGQSIEAERYRVVSDLTADIWYDKRGRWVKLAFEARGQQIEYVLASLY
ncbi:DUF6134 family protein [Hyphomonas sp. WL0036]|uniref:DUF6134 family protein n=1 Tax=Hyphomonas sediminis TaxID=2866160 RepID=UPI001C7FDE33|nr:DUF6134 family protein [Hyphomonas sediminis]MBY9067406.1 DUF6134 family protein [Hyphomonas sediminis]